MRAPAPSLRSAAANTLQTVACRWPMRVLAAAISPFALNGFILAALGHYERGGHVAGGLSTDYGKIVAPKTRLTLILGTIGAAYRSSGSFLRSPPVR